MSNSNVAPSTNNSGKGANPESKQQGTGASNGNAGTGAYIATLKRLLRDKVVYSGNQSQQASANLRISVLPDGTITQVEVISTKGDAAYAAAVQRAVRSLVRLPPRPNNEPFTGEWRNLTPNFRLKE